MDIEALLLASNQEAAGELEDAYEDVFEEEDDAISGQKSSEVDKAAVLAAAAKTVAIEEKRLADKVFNETADDIAETLKPQFVKEAEAEAILIDASKEVNEYYNENADAEEAEKYAEEEPAVDDGGESSSADGDNEENEGDSDEENASLHQSLFFACNNEKVEGVRTALRRGANYFARDRHGWTPLIWAVSKGDVEMAEVLLEHVRDKGRSVKSYVNAQDTITGWTALHVAAVGGHLQASEYLLRNRAKRSIQDFLKEIPADCIGKSKHSHELRRLLAVQSSTKRESNGATAKHQRNSASQEEKISIEGTRDGGSGDAHVNTGVTCMTERDHSNSNTRDERSTYRR